MKVKICFIVSCLSIGLAGEVLAQTLTLDSCYSMALRNYPLVKQYDLIEQTREYTLSNASKAYLPQVSLTGIAGYVFASGSGDVKFIGIAQVNQTIWDGGATKAQKKMIAAAAESEKANLEVSLYDLRSRVNQLFFGILLIDEQLSQVEQHEKVLSNNFSRIQKLNENGMAYQTDLDEIDVEQRKLNQQRTEYRYVRQGYIRILSLMTAANINEHTKLEKPAISNPFADATITRPELKFFESQRLSIYSEDERRKVDLMPKVGVLGIGALLTPEVALGPTSLSTIGVLGLNASWSINGLYRNANLKKLNQLSINKVDLQQKNFVFNTNLQVTQTKANIEKQQAILTEDKEIVDLRKRIREGYQAKHNNGVASLLDLLDATEKENEAKTQMALHEMQLLMSFYEYKTQIGN
jgi:outer membrane protein TolC